MAAPMPSSPASVAKLACASSCGAAGAVRPGSLLRVRGKTLSKADEVVFLGAAGVEDDVTAETTVRRKTSVDVRVPLGAVPGPVAIVDSNGAVSAPSAGPVALDPAAPAAAPSVEFAVRAPRALLRRRDARGRHLRRARRRAGDGRRGRRAGARRRRRRALGRRRPWRRRTPQRVAWDGTVARRRRSADGKYAFRLTVAGLAPAQRAVRVLQRPLPDPRRVAVRHRRGGVRRRARPPGRGHVRRLRDAAGRRARREGQVRGLPRRGRATTS